MKRFATVPLVLSLGMGPSAVAWGEIEAADALAKRWNSLSQLERDDAISSAVIHSAQQGTAAEQATIGIAVSKALAEETSVSPHVRSAFTNVLVDLADNPRTKIDPFHGTASSEGESLALTALDFVDPRDPAVVRACEQIASGRDHYSFQIRTSCQSLLARAGHDDSLRRIAPAQANSATTETDLIRIAQLSSPTPDELQRLKRAWPSVSQGTRDWVYSELLKRHDVTPDRAELYAELAMGDYQRGSLLLVPLSDQPPHVIGGIGVQLEQIFRSPRHSEKARASALKGLHSLRYKIPPEELTAFFETAKEERTQTVTLAATLTLHPVLEPKYVERMQRKALSPQAVAELLSHSTGRR